MGRQLREPDVQQNRELLPYHIASAPNGDVRVLMAGREYAPPEISAMILQKLKADAEDYLGAPVTKAVITVPAYFNDQQRQATRDAGKIAGLEVLRIINEPTASALAYGLEKQHNDQIVAVYDMGGGTFDISILELSEGVVQVRATSGDSYLGGDDFDQRIITWLIDQFQAEHGIDLRQDRIALQRLKEAAEKAKMELSSLLRTDINLPFITADVNGPKHLNYDLSRATLEQMTSDLIERSMRPVAQALEDAQLNANQIDTIILVGGQTRMPAVQAAVRSFFGKDPTKNVNPDEVVAVGAAVQAGVLSGDIKDVVLLDVTPLTLGIQTLGGVMTPLIERNTTIPTRKTQIFSTVAENQSSVEITVLQGERVESRHNRTLGCFELSGIPPAPRGEAQVEVTFDIDANGIARVSARELKTGKEQHITVTASSGLMPDEIEQMISEAQNYAEDDQQRRHLVATCNAADGMIYTAERVVRQHQPHIATELRQTVEDHIRSLRDLLDTQDAAAIGQKTAELSNALQPIYQAIDAMQNQADAAAPPADQSDHPASEKTDPDNNGSGQPDRSDDPSESKGPEQNPENHS